MRRNASSGPLAWTVDSAPSCPVFSAWSRSSASAPRTSPTTIAVGSHAQRGAHEIAHRHRARAFGVGRAGFEPDDVRLREPELGGLLDRDDPLVGIDRAGHRVQQRRLARARPPDTSTFQPGGHGPAQERRPRRRRAPNSSSAIARAPKRRIVTHGPSIASGGITACNREPSGEPGVDHRR